MAIGRPLKFENVQEMQVKIDAYFAECEEKGRPLTVNGLAYALDITRETLLRYAEKDSFSDAISRAKHKIQLFAEESLYNKETFKGAQFSLKNNHGWKDKSEVKQDVTLTTGLDNQLIKGRQKLREELEKGK
jgi:hypothetical protein